MGLPGGLRQAAAREGGEGGGLANENVKDKEKEEARLVEHLCTAIALPACPAFISPLTPRLWIQ